MLSIWVEFGVAREALESLIERAYPEYGFNELAYLEYEWAYQLSVAIRWRIERGEARWCMWRRQDSSSSTIRL